MYVIDDHPLPPPTADLVVATDEMLEHRGDYQFKGVPGYEDSFGFCDLGFTALTGGLIGAKALRVGPTATTPRSPWHAHMLEHHIIGVTKGWFVLEFEGVEPIRCEPGLPFVQPPRNRHRVLEMSPGMEGWEITIPAKYNTVVYLFDEEAGTYRQMDVDFDFL